MAGGEVAAALYAWVGHANAVLYPPDEPIPPGGGHAVQAGRQDGQGSPPA